jgi:hypothetical protein
MRRAIPERVPEEGASPSVQPAGGRVGGLLQLQAAGGNQMVGRLLAGQIRAKQGQGEPLPDPVRTDLEQGLGPLGEVRVHRDNESAAMAGQLGARAFTTGQDIFFGAGVYDPSTEAGRHTLAHEAAHTMQQAGGPTTNEFTVSDPGGRDEREADAVARRVTSGVHAAPSAGIQREPVATNESPAARVVRLLKENTDREATLRACMAAAGQLDEVARLWKESWTPGYLTATSPDVLTAVKLMAMNYNNRGARGPFDAVRVYAYLRYGRLRLADKLFIAGIDAGTDEDTIWRLLPQVRTQLSIVDVELAQSYGSESDTAFSDDYDDDEPLLDGTPSRVAGLIDDEMDGTEWVKSMALLTYGVLRPADDIEIARLTLNADGVMAGMERAHRETPAGTKPTVEFQYLQAYKRELRNILWALGINSKPYRRAQMILDGDFTPLNRIRLACEGVGVDRDDVWAALKDATPQQLTETGAAIREIVTSQWSVSEAEEQRLDAFLRQGNTMTDRLLQQELKLSDTKGIIKAALKAPEVYASFEKEYTQQGEFYRQFTDNERNGKALLMGGQLCAKDWQTRLRLAARLESDDGVKLILANSVTTDELRAQVRADKDLMSDLKGMSGWLPIEAMIMPRDDLQARAKWLGEKFEREEGWWGDTRPGHAFGDEKRELDAALAQTADPAHLSEADRKRLKPLVDNAESALDTFIEVRNQLDAIAIQVVGIAIGLVATALTGGAAGPVTASLLARTALVQGVASLTAIKVVKGDRATNAELARAFASGAASGVTGVLVAGPVQRLLSPQYAAVLAREGAEAAAIVAQQEFASVGMGTLKAVVEGFASNSVGSAVETALKAETWQKGIISGLGTLFQAAVDGGMQGAITGGAIEAVKLSFFGRAPDSTAPLPAPGPPDAAMIARAQGVMIEAGDLIPWQRWNSEVLPAFGAHELPARQALGLARQAHLHEISARLQPELEKLGAHIEIQPTAKFDSELEVTVRVQDEVNAAKAIEQVQAALGPAAEARLGVTVRDAGGVLGTDVYQLRDPNARSMGPNELDRALTRQVIGDGTWAVPNTTATRTDTNTLELTVPADTPAGVASIVDVSVRLVGTADLPGGAHPAVGGGSDAGPGRVQLTQPAAPGGRWSATVSVDGRLLLENVRFVVGHELDEIAKTVQNLRGLGGPITDALIAEQQAAGIFTRNPGPNAYPTAHDHSTAVELFELHQQQTALLREGTPDAVARARRRAQSMERLVGWMALDDPANMDLKLRLLQQHGRTNDVQTQQEWAEFIEELRLIGGAAVHARIAATAAPTTMVIPADLVAHLTYPALRATDFAARGLSGGHSDMELHRFLNNAGVGIRVIEEAAQEAGGNVFRRYAQYRWNGNGPAPEAGTPGAPGRGQPTPTGWTRSAVDKTTAENFNAFMVSADAAIRANGPLPVVGQVRLTTADGVPIIVQVRNGAPQTVYIDEAFLP